MHDELIEKVRGKAGQYAYTIGLYIISFSTVMFAILDALEIIENGEILEKEKISRVYHSRDSYKFI